MDTKANYVLIGLFVIVLTAAMVFGFVWLSGFSHHKIYHTYLVYARGGVNGLNIDSPVQFNGVRVGNVSKIELDAADPQFVKLYLKIEENTPITQGTVATLIPQGITGLVYVGLKAEAASAPPLTAEPGESLIVIPYEKPLLTQITEVLPDLTKNLGEITEKFKQAFSDQNLQNISDTLMHLENITAVVSKQSQSITALLKNTASASQHFPNTLVAAQQAADQLAQASKKINLEISSISQQTMPDIQELITRMNDTTLNLQQVSQDLQRNPSILIRGKQPPPPGPGEK